MSMPVLTRDEAKELGCKLYYTRNKCRNNHSAPRYVSTGRCTECRKNIRKNNFNKNSEKINARSKANKNTPEGKECHERSKLKTQARHLWAEKRAQEIFHNAESYQSVLDEIDRMLNIAYTSMCNKRDIEAVIIALKNIHVLPRRHVCHFCHSKKKTFKRASWYLKHNCFGMRKQADKVDKLIQTVESDPERFIQF